jgi:hypothetical protein
MTARLLGSTSGYTELDAPAVAGNNTLVLPNGNGSAGNILGTDGAGNLSWVNGRMVLETAKATTSGAECDFTGIPSWAKRITVMLNGVSLSTPNYIFLRLGTSAGFETTNYIGSSGVIANSPAYSSTSQTAGFNLTGTGVDTAGLYSGSAIITLMGSNTWVLQSCIGAALLARTFFSAGSKTLAGTLDRVRLNSVSGTDTFDAGSVNILYEG